MKKLTALKNRLFVLAIAVALIAMAAVTMAPVIFEGP